MNHNPNNSYADLFWGEEVKDPFVPERIIVKMAWKLDTLRLLAEVAFAIAALAFFLLKATSGNLPYYLAWLPFLVYLGQGIFIVLRDEHRPTKESHRNRAWWWLVIVILGWPIYDALAVFLVDVHGVKKWDPPISESIDYLQEKLVSSLFFGGFLSLCGYAVSAIIVDTVALYLGLS